MRENRVTSVVPVGQIRLQGLLKDFVPDPGFQRFRRQVRSTGENALYGGTAKGEVHQVTNGTQLAVVGQPASPSRRGLKTCDIPLRISRWIARRDERAEENKRALG